MHALDLLIADHNRCRGLFARFKDANANDDADTMSDLFLQILQELEVHMAIEEEIFYPMVRETNDDISETVDEGEQEHHIAKVLLAEIKQLPDGTDEWIAKVTVLRESVEHHIDEEESDLFPPLRNRIDKDVWAEMTERFEARKAELGAPTIADKIDLTKDELLDLARDQQIPGRSTMSQEELAATVAPR
jgi:iron-sulfur cluster repair protein YtfE (RIC family)